MTKIKTGVSKLPLQRVFRIFVFPRTDQARKPVQRFAVETERFTDLSRCGASSIRDDIGSHRRTELSIAFIHILNRALTLISAGKVEIDIRPLATLFGEKTLEQQSHAHRIDSG